MNETQVLRTAEACHEINRAYCEAIGDKSQVPWEKAADWQRESAVKGVRFTLENPATTPKDQHDNWCKDKIADGWTYGHVKNPIAKTHPCLVPYHDLPREQQVKDHLFRAQIEIISDLI